MACAVILFIGWSKVSQVEANRTTFFICLAATLVCAVHSLLLLVFMVRRLLRRHWLASAIFLLHALFSAAITYWLFAVWMISIAYAGMK